MTPRPTVVLIELDAPNVATFQSAALHEKGARVVLARTWPQGLALVRTEQPELVVAGAAFGGHAPDEACRSLREAGGEHAVTLALVAESVTPADAAWPWNEMPHALPHPVPLSCARAVIRSALGARAAHEALREARGQVAALTAALGRQQDELTALLVSIVEFRLPGAVGRADRRLALAQDLCERLSIPQALRRDLDLAVRLEELGHLVAGVTNRDAWRAAQSARSILDSIPGFEGAAELLAGQCENWDGTGMPGHLLQGQIPLRARILRVLADYVDATEGPGAPDAGIVLERIAERSGTWYDPMVVVHLRALAAGQDSDHWHSTRIITPVEDLRVGMVLAEDLYTDSGLKLLSQGTEITPASLETILRRHRVEPLLHGAAILRRSA